MTMSTPFTYRVRRSPRAKHVRLQVTSADGVVVVVPKGFDEKLLPELVARETAWVQGQLHRLRDAGVVPGRDEPPTRVDLDACSEQWLISYEPTASARLLVTATDTDTLRIRGPVEDRERVDAALRRWLARRARATLVERLDVLSGRYELPYVRATIRFQRSRWGSCSSRGTISLNARLMFLPARLVRCVLAHELCHTVHLDHGPRFWSLLDELEPDHRALHKELRRSWDRIPAWTFA